MKRSNDKVQKPHKFASEDLIGSMSTGIRSGDNATIRRIITQRLREKHEESYRYFIGKKPRP